MSSRGLLILLAVIVFEVFARGGDHGGHDHGGHDHGGHDHGGHDHGGHDHHGGWGGHDHHDHHHHHGGWGHDHDHGDGSGIDNGWGYRPFTGGNYYGGGGGGLLSRLFGWRRRGYYSGYPNYGYNGGFCRLSQFVDYVGSVPRFYCDCPPYPPNYQWNQCVPMAAYGK